MAPMYTLGVAILTLQAESSIAACLKPILNSPLKPKILLIDSSSTDQTVSIAEQLGVQTVIIPQKEFNHGLTREKARQLLNTDIVTFLTQDALLVHENALEKLILPIVTNSASIAYARQLPHAGADCFEAFHRAFNYPEESERRTLHDVEKWGVYTCFCSNSCAAYSNSALNEIGGFPETLFGEDTIAAAKLLTKGHAIAYVAEAEVLHSHSYTLAEEFYRHFDIGIYRQKHAALFERFGSDSKRGKQYALLLMKHLWREKPWLIPYAAARIVVKWLGYRIGRASEKATIGGSFK